VEENIILEIILKNAKYFTIFYPLFNFLGTPPLDLK